nr:MAG TPA: cytokine receptor common subunit [Caudoviricetes sp.]
MVIIWLLFSDWFSCIFLYHLKWLDTLHSKIH